MLKVKETVYEEGCSEIVTIEEDYMEKKFKCKDEVIVRLKESGCRWFYGVVSHSDDVSVVLSGGFCHPYEIYDVLPYVGNEHLVGTEDEHEEEIVLKEGELVLLSDTALPLKEGKGIISGYEEIVYGNIIAATNGRHYNYCIPMSKYNFNNLEETRKWILCAKNGKLVKVNLK